MGFKGDIDSLSGSSVVTSARKQYILTENFDKGVIPQGWTQASSGAPATINYVQPYQTGVIGHVNMNAPGPAALFTSLIFANGYNYLLNFSDCKYTLWSGNISRTPTDVGVALIGLTNVIGTAVPSVFANVIALVHDRNNMTGANPGLTNNWFVWVKDASGQSIYDTGIAPTGLVWQFVDFNYNNIGTPYLEVKIDGVVVATVPNTDPNLFVSQIAGVGAGLKPCLYCGKTIAATGGNNLRVDQFNLFREWN